MSDLVQIVQSAIDEMADDYEYGFDYWDLKHALVQDLGFSVAEEESLIDQGRWWTRRRTVFERNDDFVAVSWNVGSTEMQFDTEPEHEIQAVVPVSSIRYEVVK